MQITLSRFNQVVYNAQASSATVGAGLIWDDVYAGLEPHGVNVVGGRVTGVGVAGFSLGGGASTACVSVPAGFRYAGQQWRREIDKVLSF